MKFIAMRPLFGDYGSASPGDVIDVPQHLVRKFELLEGKGIVRRWKPPVDRKSFVVTRKMKPEHDNKALKPPENKSA